MPQSQDLFEKYKAPIESFIGAVRNKVSFDSYEDAMDHINELKTYKDSVRKVQDITDKLTSVDLNNVPLTKPVDKEVIDPNWMNYYTKEELQNVKPLSNYLAYSEEQSKNGKDILSMDDYLKNRPDLYNELKTTHGNIFKKQTDQQPMSNDELTAEYYRQAGLKPEDVKWYLENKGKYTATQYNERINDLVTKYVPYFINRGQEGQNYASLLSTEGGNMLIKPKAYKFEKIGQDLFRIDPETGTAKIIAKGDGKEKPSSTVKPTIVYKDGQYYHHIAYESPKGLTFKDVLDTDQTDAKGRYDEQQHTRELKTEKLSPEEHFNFTHGQFTTGSGLHYTPPDKKGRKGTGEKVTDSHDQKDVDKEFLTMNDYNAEYGTHVDENGTPKTDADEKWLEKRREHEQDMMKKYHKSEEEIFAESQKLGGMDDKEAKKYINQNFTKMGVDKSTQVDNSTMQKRASLYDQKNPNNYFNMLDKQYKENPAGYEKMLLQFYNEIKWDLDNGIINKEFYDALHKAYQDYK
jgi:hypothetical protein